MKIGYIPYSADLTHADDRRRFPYFARRHNIAYELADERKDYDIVILPAPANLTKWLRYKKTHLKTVFIFEMVDSLIHQNDWQNMLVKGWGRFIIGKESRPSMIHKNLLIRWIKEADIVVCSNPQTLKTIQNWNDNVVFSLDYLEHEYHYIKNDYSIKGKMKLFWEGQGVVLPQLLYFKNVFERVNSFCELHIVTSESFPVFGQFLQRKTESFLKELPIESHFHLWNQERNPDLFAGFDCGIIPINKNDKYAWHKPANKLISFWLSGIPTLASDTPAYTDIALQTENDFLCSSDEEWVTKILEIRNMNDDERKNMAIRKYNFARELFSDQVHDTFWVELFKKAELLYAEKSSR